MPPAIRYELLARDAGSHARCGRVHTPHGAFDTPAFMPVGTQGTVKGIVPDHVAATGAQIIDLMFAMNAEAGTTLILVTHDEALAHRCGRTLRLDAGRIVG